MKPIIFDAIKKKLRVQLIYHDFRRVVEPHTYGNTTAGNDAIRAYQVSGGSVSNEPVGWKMFCMDEMIDLQLLEEAAQMPRPGYKQGDRGMQTIYCQI